MNINRDIYLSKLIRKKNNGLIKVITGMRRCGKSYLLFDIFKNHLLQNGINSEHIVEVAFDDFENIELCDPRVFMDYLKTKISDDGEYYILLDEIQLLEQFEAVLNSLLRKRNVDIYVTGSNARFLSKDVITEFRGRGDEVHMYPLSFAEFLSVYPGTQEQAWNEYMVFGGLPMILQFEDNEDKSNYLRALIEETYIADIVGRHNVRNKDELEDLLNIISSGIGSLTNPNKLSKSFQSIKNKTISVNTIRNYLEYLQDAFMIDSAVRYDVKGKKYINTPLKYYFTDIGIRNARLNFRQIEPTHTMENIIFNELKMRGYNVDVGVVPVNEKDEKGNGAKKQLEIDFVCNKSDKRYYIQSAYAMPNQAKMEQEQKSLLKVNDAFKKIIITKDTPVAHYNENGVLILNLYDFLLDSKSLEQ